MTNEQKRIEIETNYINGNLTDAKRLFSKLTKQERKDFATDRAAHAMIVEGSASRQFAGKLAEFLIQSI